MNNELEVRIEGMHCVSCSAAIEKAVQSIPGVRSVKVDYALGLGTIHSFQKVSSKKVVQAIRDAGYNAEVLDHRSIQTFSSFSSFYSDPHFLNFFIALLLTFPLLLNMAGEFLNSDFRVSPQAEWVIATIVQFWCGRTLYKGAFGSLKALSPTMDLLVVIGSLASYFLSCFLLLQGKEHLYFETGAFIITVVLFGRWIEGESKEKAGKAFFNLMKLRSKKVRVDRLGEIVEIDPFDMKAGEIFYVSPGEMVAVDGRVMEGISLVNEEALFGEKLPHLKQPEDLLYAGSLNLEGLLKARADKVGSDTILEHVIERAKRLHTTKAPIQRLADQIAQVFVPAILLTALVVFIAWWFRSHDLITSLMPAISTLLIACPCAIGMATPIALLVASSLSSKNGILFHDAKAIETASKIDTFCFDKTGTITEGDPSVQKIILYKNVSEADVLNIVASMETFSTHPIAKAIVSFAKKRNIQIEPISRIRTLVGRGIEAEKRGELYFAGSLAYAKEIDVFIPAALRHEEGGTTVVLIHNKEIVASIHLKDIIRPYAKEVVEELKNRGMELYLMTGDQSDPAHEIARQVGIENVLSGVLPDKKVDAILQLRSKNRILGMCGDGMNDAFALAAADVGFSLESGSDFAIDSSDVTLMKKDLRGILDTIDLSSATIKKIKQNLYLASIYNIVAIPLAASGLLNPMIAATAMVASSLSVVINALLLRSWKPRSFNPL